jgi:hypothetical protein
MRVDYRFSPAFFTGKYECSKVDGKHDQIPCILTFAVSLALTAITCVLAGISMSRTDFHPPEGKFVLTPSTKSSTISSSAVMASLLVSAKHMLTV